MGNKFIILALLITLSMFTLVSAAEDTTQSYKQFDSVNYSFRCYDTNGSYCTSTTSLIMNVEYPNGTNAVDNQTLIFNGSNFKGVLPTDTIGNNYRVLIHSETSNNTITEFSYDVTPSGFRGTLGFYFLILAFSGGIIFLGYKGEDHIIVILGSFGLYFIAFYVLFFGIDGIKDPVYTWAIGLISLSFAAYLSIRATYEAFF